MDIKYIVRNNKELEFLENAYKKLTKYYEIYSESGLEIESTFSAIKIFPQGIGSKISKVQRNDLECVVEEGEDFCDRCGHIFHEEKTNFAHNIEIKGTRYHIKLKHKLNYNYDDEQKRGDD